MADDSSGHQQLRAVVSSVVSIFMPKSVWDRARRFQAREIGQGLVEHLVAESRQSTNANAVNLAGRRQR